jgi:hypothetical protein
MDANEGQRGGGKTARIGSLTVSVPLVALKRGIVWCPKRVIRTKGAYVASQPYFHIWRIRIGRFTDFALQCERLCDEPITVLAIHIPPIVKRKTTITDMCTTQNRRHSRIATEGAQNCKDLTNSMVGISKSVSASTAFNVNPTCTVVFLKFLLATHNTEFSQLFLQFAP